MECVLCGVLDVAEVDCLKAHCEGQEGEEGDGVEMHSDSRLLVVDFVGVKERLSA